MSAALCISLGFLGHGLRAQAGRRTPGPPQETSQPEATRQRRASPSPAAQEQPPQARPSPQPATDVNVVDSVATGAVEEDEVVRINSNLVAVLASVMDERGRAVTDLKLEDFELRVDGQLKSLGDLARSETPVRMALLFDNSSSVSPSRKFQMEAAVQFFRRVMRPIDQAAVYSVSTAPALMRPLTSDVRTLVRTVENFGKPEGATALFDAIAQAADYLGQQQGRKVIIIVSDGVDTVSNLDFDSTLARVQAADCQIYVVQTGYIDNANLRDLVAETRMNEFASQTGGAVFRPQVTDDLYAAFSQIAADLAEQYVLSYYPADDRRDGRFHTITLKVTTRPKARVRARKGYYAPKGSSP